MHVTLEISDNLGHRIAADASTLSRTALEALALEAIRAGKLTVSEGLRLFTLEDVRRDSEVARALPG
jgi:hypothetical protein